MADEPRPKISIPADWVLKRIQEGKKVRLKNAVIKGNLDILELDLPTRHVERTQSQKKMGLSEDVKIVQSSIKITDSTIEGYFDFRNTILSWDVRFDGATFSGYVRFDGATFSENAGFEGATFRRYARFDGATFRKYADFEGASFSGRVKSWGSFSERHGFESAGFEGATFRGFTGFKRAIFNYYAGFERASFNDARFNGASFFDAGFKGTTFSGYAGFEGVSFSGYAGFKGACFSMGTDFEDVSFSMDAEFEGVSFSMNAKFKGASFSGYAGFKRTSFSGRAKFEGAKFEGGILTFRDATFIYAQIQEDACRRAKNVQAKAGNRDEEEYHFYREMEAKRIQKGIRGDSGLSLGDCLRNDTYSFWKFFFHDVLEFVFVQKIFGYGVHPFRLFGWWLAFVVIFAIIYSIKGAIEQPDARQWYDYLWFSVATAATPGYALYKPLGLFKIIAGIEAILGTFMWAAFITTFARKFMR